MRLFEQVRYTSPAVSDKITLTTLEGQKLILRSADIIGVQAIPAAPRSTVYTGNQSKVYTASQSFLVRDTVENIEATIDAGLSVFYGYVSVEDQKSANTAGGTATSGAWRTRVLNTEVSDSDALASLSSNQVTLEAGTYLCRARAPGYQVYHHQIRLRDITASSTLLLGSNARSSTTDDTQTDSFLSGKITLTVPTILELQHQVSTTKATYGFGIPINLGGTEVYSTLEFFKLKGS